MFIKWTGNYNSELSSRLRWMTASKVTEKAKPKKSHFNAKLSPRNLTTQIWVGNIDQFVA